MKDLIGQSLSGHALYFAEYGENNLDANTSLDYTMSRGR